MQTTLIGVAAEKSYNTIHSTEAYIHSLAEQYAAGPDVKVLLKISEQEIKMKKETEYFLKLTKLTK